MADIGEQKDVDRKKNSLAEAASSRAMAIRALCQHQQGRDLLWFIMESASPYASSMRNDDTGRGDPMRTAYAEGFRGHGTLVMAEVMRADPNAYVLMLSENTNVKELEKVETEND